MNINCLRPSLERPGGFGTSPCNPLLSDSPSTPHVREALTLSMLIDMALQGRTSEWLEGRSYARWSWMLWPLPPSAGRQSKRVGRDRNPLKVEDIKLDNSYGEAQLTLPRGSDSYLLLFFLEFFLGTGDRKAYVLHWTLSKFMMDGSLVSLAPHLKHY